MFKKNVAVTGFTIGCFISTTDGSEVTTGTPTCTRIIDGSAASCANAASYNATLTAWEIDLAAADLNGDMIGLVFKLSGCLPIVYNIKTVTGIPNASGNYPYDATTLLDLSDGVESSVTPRQTLRAIAAVLAGLVSGAGTGVEVFKGIGQASGGTTRVTVSVDSAGNRSQVTLNLS